MINLPEEFRLGVPRTDTPDSENARPVIPAVRFRTWRDKADPSKIDLELTLTQAEREELIEQLQACAHDDEASFEFDAAGTIGIMPPDPMGPAAIAAYNFAAAMQPPTPPTASSSPDDYLAIATLLLTQLKAGLGFGPCYLPESFEIPTIPAPKPTDNPNLNILMNKLVAAVNNAATFINDAEFDPASKPEQLDALMHLRADVEEAFS